MKITVQPFAACRDVFRASEFHEELESDTTVELLLEVLVRRAPAFERFKDAVQLAVNDEFASRDRRLEEGDVVALLPPVSGG